MTTHVLHKALVCSWGVFEGTGWSENPARGFPWGGPRQLRTRSSTWSWCFLVGQECCCFLGREAVPAFLSFSSGCWGEVLRWAGRGGEWPLWLQEPVSGPLQFLAVTAFLLENVHTPWAQVGGLATCRGKPGADHLQVLLKGRWGHTVGPSRLPQPLLLWSQVSHIQLE